MIANNVRAMDLESVHTYIEEESNRGELLIYVAVGCAVGRYPEGEHPMQQYPPYLRQFACPQICVLIDPMLEMPPRAIADVLSIDRDITILPVLTDFYHTSDSLFLGKLATLCSMSHGRIRMIVQEFNGSNTNLHYPIHLGRGILKTVLYDPTYSDGGGCSPDLSSPILLDENGGFLQPYHDRLCDVQKTCPSALFKQQLADRLYPVVHLLQRNYRILRNLEEPRDWCTDEVVSGPLLRFRFIYNVCAGDRIDELREILMAVVQDLCVVSESYLSEADMLAIVDSGGNELETMWKSVRALLEV